jgi:hypothetical protein
MHFSIKNGLVHIGAIIVFLVLVFVYFAPSVLNEKMIKQVDMQKAVGMATDVDEYYKKTGIISTWSGTMFSGMPSYQTRFYRNSPNYLNYLEKPIKIIDYTGASMILTALICFYILMCTIGVKKWIAITGAVAFAFSSYNFIVIAVGHITKMYVIAYMPLTISGIVLFFKKNWLWGIVFFVLGICFSIINNHIQITYYLILFCVFFSIGLIINKFRKKEYSFILKISLIIMLSIACSILPSLENLHIDYELSRESTRSGSELIISKKNKKQSSGLDINYAFLWSYGRCELFTLLIPNIYGGSSVEVLDKNSHFYKTYKSLGGKLCDTIQAPTYWGEQPFTSGPVYFGAIVCFLFILGIFVIENSAKWWILLTSLFFIFMSLGKNFMLLNEFLFYHLPMYNKFRTPSMSLVIPSIVFPFIGFYGLSQILNEKVCTKRIKKSLVWSFSIVGGICLLIWIMPTVFFKFTSSVDTQYLSTWPIQLINALIADRVLLASHDAFRSFSFVLLASILVYFFLKLKNKKTGLVLVSVGIFILVTIDMWGINKRYLNDRSFVNKKFDESYKKTEADKFILRDTSLSYRVLNLSVDTFNETNTSFFHKSIGGYHAAKLRRYQELIDHYISSEIGMIKLSFRTISSFYELQQNVFKNIHILNMLNTKYIIFNPDKAPLVNSYACGNVWFVNKYIYVNNADQEIKTLNNIDPFQTAVINKNFSKLIKIKNHVYDSTDFIQLVEYNPNYLKYMSSTISDRIAVFSEIYYKNGWKSFIDGIQTDHFCANWVLRSMCIPSGDHIIEFRFEPDKHNLLAKISSVSSLCILLGFIGIISYKLKRKYRFMMMK